MVRGLGATSHVCGDVTGMQGLAGGSVRYLLNGNVTRNSHFDWVRGAANPGLPLAAILGVFSNLVELRQK